MAIPRPSSISIDQILHSLASKIAKLELENSQYEITIAQYETLCDTYECPACGASATREKAENKKEE